MTNRRPKCGPYRIDITSKYVINNETGCWIWIKGKDKDGYGIHHPYRVDGKPSNVRAHRWFYEQKYGPIPEDLVLDHVVCQNTSCVNPDHMEPVTSTENLRRGRGTKIPQTQIELIKALYALGARQIDIARKYNVHQSTINRIVLEKRRL